MVSWHVILWTFFDQNVIYCIVFPVAKLKFRHGAAPICPCSRTSQPISEYQQLVFPKQIALILETLILFPKKNSLILQTLIDSSQDTFTPLSYAKLGIIDSRHLRRRTSIIPIYRQYVGLFFNSRHFPTSQTWRTNFGLFPEH